MAGLKFYIPTSNVGNGYDRSAGLSEILVLLRRIRAHPFQDKKEAAHFRVRIKKKDFLSEVLCVGITYFHGPSPGNYRRRK